MNRLLIWGQEPYPENSPICISEDCDMGWIIENVDEGEYIVENLPYIGKNEEPDFDLAFSLAKEKGTYIKYYTDQCIVNIIPKQQ